MLKSVTTLAVVLLLVRLLFLSRTLNECTDQRGFLSSVTQPLERVALVIPYRDRDAQGKKFIEHMLWFANETEKASNRTIEYHIVFAEQFDDTPFNRAWLFNIGFVYSLELGIAMPDSCVAIQDVDNYPLPGVDYTDCQPPTHIAAEAEALDWWHLHDNFCGIAFVMNTSKWQEINGMSNKYVGWGHEDNDLFFRIRQTNNLVCGKVRRPESGKGRFAGPRETSHRDGRHGGEWWDTHNRMENGEPLWKTDGLNSLTVNWAFKHSTGRVGDSNVFVHSVAGTRETLPDLLAIEIVAFPGICGETAHSSYFASFPASLQDIRSSICPHGHPIDESIPIILLSLSNGNAQLLNTWGAAVRWFRSRKGEPSAVIARTYDPKQAHWFPRTMPACVFKWNDREHDLVLGTPWNSAYGGDSVDSLLTFHSEDEDLSALRPDTIRLCLAKDDNKSFSVTAENDCAGNDKKYVFFPRSGPGKSLCVGHSDELSSDRFEVTDNCNRDSFKHTLYFKEPTDSEKQLSSCFKPDSKGNASTDCSDLNALTTISANETVQFQKTVLCLSSNSPLEHVSCDSDDAVKWALPIASESPKHWCLGRHVNSNKVCLERSECSKCLNGIMVRSVTIEEIPIESLVFRRDANIH